MGHDSSPPAEQGRHGARSSSGSSASSQGYVEGLRARADAWIWWGCRQRSPPPRPAPQRYPPVERVLPVNLKSKSHRVPSRSPDRGHGQYGRHDEDEGWVAPPMQLKDDNDRRKRQRSSQSGGESGLPAVGMVHGDESTQHAWTMPQNPDASSRPSVGPAQRRWDPPPANTPTRRTPPPPPPPPPTKPVSLTAGPVKRFQSAAAASATPPAVELRGPATALGSELTQAPSTRDVVCMDGNVDEGSQQLTSVASCSQPSPVNALAGSTTAASSDTNKMVLVEILYKGKKKTVKHKASTKISELLSMYEKRFGNSTMRICDENGLEQGSEVTLGLLQESIAPQSADSTKGPVQLTFEEDDWFD